VQTTLELDNVDPQSADEIRERVNDFYRDFPLVAPALGTVKLDASQFVPYPNSYAVTYPIPDITSPVPPYCIALNPRLFGAGTRERLVSSVLSDTDGDFHRYTQPSGVIEHELGHVLDMWVASRNPLQMFPSFALEFDDAHTISEYAKQSPQEAFAEAFANDRLGWPAGNESVRHVLTSTLAIARQAASYA
jgi:hypothetical protein